MDRRLLDYLPPVLREVREFQTINAANGPEIAAAWDAAARLLANQFLETADADGVALWEKELNIFPKDTDTLDARKTRIKSAWNLELPYTVPWLRNWLSALCGASGYQLTVSEYVATIQLDCNALLDINSQSQEILNTILTVCPSNMVVLMTMRAISAASVYVGLAPRQGEVCIVGPVECSGYLKSQVSVAAVARRGDVVRMAALACPQPTEPVYVGLAPRQGEVYIVGPVKCRGDVKSQVYVAAVARRGDVVRMNALACPQPEETGT